MIETATRAEEKVIARMDDTREIMTADQAAEFIGYAPVTVRKLARERQIPCRKMGKEWRFTRRQLIEWIETGGTSGDQSAMALD